MNKKNQTVWLARCDNIGDLMITLPLIERVRKFYFFKVIVNSYAFGLANLVLNPEEVISTEDFCKLKIFDDKDCFIPLNASKNVIEHVQKHFKGDKLGYFFRPKDWRYANKFSMLRRGRMKSHESHLMILFASRLLPEVLNNDSLFPLNKSILKKLSANVAQASNSNLTSANLIAAKSDKRKIIFHPGSNANGREWPISHWIDAIHKLSQFDIEIHITGRGDEGKRIIEDISLIGKYYNFVDEHKTIASFMHHLSNVDLLVSCGTGPAHLAAALGTQVLTLFPPIDKIGAIRWRPIGESVHTMTAPTADGNQCRYANSCSNSDCLCMNNLSVNAVVAAIKFHLSL